MLINKSHIYFLYIKMSYPKYKLMEFETQYPVTPFIPNNANGKKVAKKKFQLEIRQCKVEIEHHHWNKFKWKTGIAFQLAKLY